MFTITHQTIITRQKRETNRIDGRCVGGSGGGIVTNALRHLHFSMRARRTDGIKTRSQVLCVNGNLIDVEVMVISQERRDRIADH